MTRYRVLIADPLLAAGLLWPEGCALAGQLEPGPAGTHWHLLDDPAAPEGLEGKDVALKMGRREDGTPEIAGRHVIVTHLRPQDDDALMPCCGMTPFEVPRSDRVTGDAADVTCGRPS